jgi:hypothetical protein
MHFGLGVGNIIGWLGCDYMLFCLRMGRRMGNGFRQSIDDCFRNGAFVCVQITRRCLSSVVDSL